MEIKSKNKGKLLSVIFVTLMVFSLATSFAYSIPTKISFDIKNSFKLNYITHDPIVIDSNDDFGPSGYNFPGLGTAENPYRIANLSITNAVDVAISISYTTDYFVIENCYLEALPGAAHGISIHFVNSGTALIRNNTCNNWIYGIYIEQSSGSIIRNNTITKADAGIMTENCDGSIIELNTCDSNKVGIHSLDDYITINSNTLKDNLVALMLFTVPNANISDNNLINNGLYMKFDSASDYLTLTFYNNSINDIQIVVLFNLDDDNIDAANYGQIILVNCSRVTIDSIIPLTTVYGVHLFFCTDCTISELDVRNNMYCINAEYSPETTILNTFCTTNYFLLNPEDLNIDGIGIRISYSNDSYIEGNECTFYEAGIYLQRSHFTEISENTFRYNDFGLSTFSSDLTIRNNIIQENVEGITIYASSSLPASNILIKYNTIQENEYYGLTLMPYSEYNIIHHNYFTGNNHGGTSQASDSGVNNIWYDDTVDEGNWWSDWSGTGAYSIDGTASAVDPYPLGSSIPEFNSWKLFVLVSIIPILLIPIMRKKKK